MKLIKRSDEGYAVSDIQRRLIKLKYSSLIPDGVFDLKTEHAVKDFQQSRGLLVDGVVGDETWQELVEASYFLGERTIYLKSPSLRGDDIKTIQLWLRTIGFNPGPIDGLYGPKTEGATKNFQKNTGLESDGIISSSTIKAFYNLRLALESNAQVEFPKKETQPLSTLDTIQEQEILVDFGHGGSDYGAIGPSGLKENEIAADIGMRLGELLKILGAKVTYSRKLNRGKSTLSRIDFANKKKSSLLISIHLNHALNPKAEGSSTYYFETAKFLSKEGQKLANEIQGELVKSLKTKDCRVHGKNFNILRLTKMPAVIVEPFFITNVKEEALLKQSWTRQKIAYAIFDGLKSYLKTN